ncbi:conserved hypothetical protein [Ricinus communis]|uniref:Uncharacterized protein n=1 Tax=Ricinus communis TaxID=3988 RepID=B9STN4_RICCO|nr:conserved hypothetical protein [Ricinus communis]
MKKNHLQVLRRKINEILNLGVLDSTTQLRTSESYIALLSGSESNSWFAGLPLDGKKAKNRRVNTYMQNRAVLEKSLGERPREPY